MEAYIPRTTGLVEALMVLMGTNTHGLNMPVKGTTQPSPSTSWAMAIHYTPILHNSSNLFSKVRPSMR